MEQQSTMQKVAIEGTEKQVLRMRIGNRTLDNFRCAGRSRARRAAPRYRALTLLRLTRAPPPRAARRFVLDHRIGQLTHERGPVFDHVDKLEAHIRELNEELVREFAEKKESDHDAALKEAKLEGALSDIQKLRCVARRALEAAAAAACVCVCVCVCVRLCARATACVCMLCVRARVRVRVLTYARRAGVRDKERLITAFQSDLEVLSRSTDVKSLEQGVKQL